MAKQKSMNKQLLDEVQPQVQGIMDQIQNLEKEAQNKRAGIERFKVEIEQREKQIKELRSEAEQALARGQDPMPTLDQVAGLESEIKVMEGLLDTSEDPDRQEQAQIEQLNKVLQRELARAVNSSQARSDMREGFEARIQDLKDYMEAWRQSEKELFGAYSLSVAGVGGNPFILKNKELSSFCYFTLARL